MNNSMVKIFENEQFGKVRLVEINDEPWFVLKDVCKAFGETNYRRVASKIEDYEKGVSQIDTPGGLQNMTIINESGLYSALFQMQPAKARNVSDAYISERQEQLRMFKRWVTHDVLPSIRKTGGYIMGQEEMSDIELLSRAVLVAQNQIAQRDSRIAEMEPVVDFAQRCLLAKGAVTTTSVAKNYGLSANKLNQLLKGLGVQYKVGNQWVLYSQYQDCGYTETRRTPIQKKDGEVVLVSETLWTSKGIEFIDQMLQSVNISKT